jgi:4-diphosphocytidyl-2-C-methyl-D-erythritol kinase
LRVVLRLSSGGPPSTLALVLILPSFAKINWTLRVLGRRDDDLHEIRTIFQTVDLHDKLTFLPERAGITAITCDAPDVPSDERNIVCKAAAALRDRFHLDNGISIQIEKQIPIEAGLGGGSSNAAVTLLALAHLWNIETNKQELEAIGTRLGADVPFFLNGGTAVGAGIGADVSLWDEFSAAHMVIVTPNARVSTREAYLALGARSLTKSDSESMLSISRADAQLPHSPLDALVNDFERVVLRLKPEIERALSALRRAGASRALLAGSGSSVFGIFDNREVQEHAADSLRSEAGWRVFLCCTLARHEYLKMLGPCASVLQRLP